LGQEPGGRQERMQGHHGNSRPGWLVAKGDKKDQGRKEFDLRPSHREGREGEKEKEGDKLFSCAQ